MGEYVRKSFTFEGKRYFVKGKTEEEAIIKRAEKKKELEAGRVVVSSSMSVSDWAYKAVETYKTRQKDVTRKVYLSRMRHCILEEIGSMPLKTVKPIHCQNVLNLQAGKSAAQISEIYQILRFIFRTAQQNGLIATNPAEYIVKPIGTKTHRRAITDRERAALLQVAESDPRFNLFLLMLFCGCRPSEAINAQGQDIQMIDGYPVLHIRGTKTVNADRLVPIPSFIFQKIKGTSPFSYICPNNAGNRHTQKSYQRVWLHLRREMNLALGCRIYRNQLLPPFPLAEDFVPYCLRHTYCTDLQKKGVDIRTAQYLMGHSDIRMTANIYTHADNSTVVSAAKLLL